MLKFSAYVPNHYVKNIRNTDGNVSFVVDVECKISYRIRLFLIVVSTFLRLSPKIMYRIVYKKEMQDSK